MLVAIVFLVYTAYSHSMTMTDGTTELTFETRHLIGNLEGTAKGINATLTLDSNNLFRIVFQVFFCDHHLSHNGVYLGPNLTKQECLM
jgi:hypothetical protein